MGRLGRLLDRLLPVFIQLDPMVAIAYSVAMAEASPDRAVAPPRPLPISRARGGLIVLEPWR